MGCCSSMPQFGVPGDYHLRQISLTSEGSDCPLLIIKPERFVVQHEGSVKQSVYEAVHLSSKARRAVKILTRNSLPETQLNAVLSEVSLLRSLVIPTQDHPNILKIFEVVVEDETVNIVSEMMTGGDLLTKITKMKKLPERLAAMYMLQLLSAVAYCHERCIVHRDLKLENLLLESHASNSLLKIIDFGNAAKLIPGSSLTLPTGTVPPTQAFYAAPEVLSEHYTEKCDIWSCGVILYMLLSGRPPFGGRSEQEVLEKVRKGRFDFPSEAWEGVSDDAKEIVSLMLTKNVVIRPSAKDLLHHSWLHEGDRVTVSNKVEEVNILNRLKNFRVRGQLGVRTPPPVNPRLHGHPPLDRARD